MPPAAPPPAPAAPARGAMGEVRWLAILGAALLAQHLLVDSSLTRGLASWAPSFEATPPTPPVHFEVAKSEDEINAQQRHSAEVFQQLAAEKPLGGVDEVEAPQPDEVRQAMPAIDQDSHELKCGQKIPAESLVVTRGVEIFVKSTYRGGGRSGHSWSYVVEMRNVGEDTVQMLTRHWVFTDSTGKVHEMKGPGARGVTPVLRPGESWRYESGSSLATPSGAMHGSFQFETLRSVSGVRPSMFSGRVGRLALSPTNSLELAPCGEAAAAHLLPTTSVRATRRIIVGASVDYLSDRSRPGEHHWAYDVQINNAREMGVTVTEHRWVTWDERGKKLVQEGTGVGGTMAARTHHLPAGEAFRTKGILVASTPTANANGFYTVTAEPIGGGEPLDIQAEIGLIGLSRGDEPVADVRPEDERDAFE